MGRPKKEDARENVFHIRLSKEEECMLAQLSYVTEESKADIVRRAISNLYSIYENRF